MQCSEEIVHIAQNTHVTNLVTDYLCSMGESHPVLDIEIGFVVEERLVSDSLLIPLSMDMSSGRCPMSSAWNEVETPKGLRFLSR
jgi:hypothetical protein